MILYIGRDKDDPRITGHLFLSTGNAKPSQKIYMPCRLPYAEFFHITQMKGKGATENEENPEAATKEAAPQKGERS